MKKTRLLWILVGLCLLFLVMPAFAGGGSQKSNQRVTITVMDYQAYALEHYDRVAQNFARIHGINVELSHHPNDYDQLLQARVNSGQTPDVFVLGIGPMLEAYADYAYDWKNEPILSLFREDVLKDTTLGGKIIALPWIAEVYSLIYNKKVFRDAGITNLPKNLRDLEAVCIRLKNAGVTPFTVGFGSSWVIGQLASSFIAAEHPDANVTVNALTSGAKSFADLTYFKNVFDLIDMMLKYGPDKPLEYDWERSEAALASGAAGITHMGNWAEAMFRSFNPNIEMAFIPTPITWDNSFEPKLATGTDCAYLVHKNGKNLDISKKFVEYFITSDDGVNFMSQSLGAIPPLKKQPANINGQLSNDASRYIEKGLSLPWAFQRFPFGAMQYLENTLQSYAAGDVSREEAMRLMTNRWRTFR